MESFTSKELLFCYRYLQLDPLGNTLTGTSNKTFDTICSEALLLLIILLVWYYCTLKQYYSVSEAALVASNEEDFDHLRTDTGKLYRNSFFHHTVEVFINNTTDPRGISKIWLKRSPCVNCSHKLISFYKYIERKPTLYIGQVSRSSTTRDREGMKQLLQNGFKLRTWTRLYRLLQQHCNEDGSYEEIRHYLQELKQETRNENLNNINKNQCSIL